LYEMLRNNINNHAKIIELYKQELGEEDLTMSNPDV